MSLAGVANGAWRALSAPAAKRFAQALVNPGGWQRQSLRRLLKRNATSAFGRAHGFAAIGDAQAYRDRVPLRTYQGFTPWIDRIRAGEPGVLTSSPVTRLVPTGGSTGGAKLIPWTADLGREFAAVLAAWTVDLQRSYPAVRGGPAYWSITPMGAATSEGPVAVGFADDTAYLGGLVAPLVASTLAAPGCLARIPDRHAFLHATLRCLLARRELRLISVWHPSFLGLLLDHAIAHRTALLHDLSLGGISVPLSSGLAAAMRPWLRPDPRRAAELAKADWSSPRSLWPRLALVSCWADAEADVAARALTARLDGVPIQAKGLLATEAAISLPWRGRHVAAVNGAVVEFLAEDGTPRWMDEVRDGTTYEVVLTTGGGLYRYRLGDRVRVEGFVGRTPCLRFLGRAGAGCDLVGEKLDPAFVAACLARELPACALAVLAPSPARDGYVLLCDRLVATAHLAAVDRALAGNPQYDLARRLGQLAPLRTQRVTVGDWLSSRRATCLGAVKPMALVTDPDWAALARAEVA